MENIELLQSRVASTYGDEDDFYGEYTDWESFAPEGWRYLGKGMQRVCYLGPDEMVYKFHLNPRASHNHNEFRNCEWLQDRADEDVYIPSAHMIGDVLVMEYVHGVKPPWCDGYERENGEWRSIDCDCGKPWGMCWSEKMHRLGLADVHNENVLIVGDVIVPIDLVM